MTKPAERAAARRFRAEEGESIRAIAARIGVSVSSVSAWVRDVPLDEAQKEALRQRDPRFDARARGTGSRQIRAKALRARWQADGRRLACSGDPLHRTGCMLHWAEGSKKRNTVCFVNSDVDMMRLFVRFLRDCYGAEDAKLTLSVNCFLNNGLTLDQIERFWLEALNLPASCLRTAAVNRASSASRRAGRTLPYGTARISWHSTAVAQSIYGAIQEYGGFDRPEWLD